MKSQVVGGRNSGKRTLTSVLAEQVRELIISGRIPPGSQLSETELAERFATSRGPVREAVQRLVQEGLLMSKPHRGTYVPVLEREDVADLAFARATLEKGALTRIAARGASARLIADLEHVLDKMEAAAEQGDWRAIAEADVEFHETLVDAADSFQLSRMYASLAGLMRISLITHTLVEYRDNTRALLEEHRKLASLIIRGSSDMHQAIDQHFSELLAENHDTLASSERTRKGAAT